jgi:uncharacterized iron-regulated protein
MKPPMLKIQGLAQPMAIGTIVDTQKARAISFDQLIDQLEQVRVIYVGENHTDRSHHRIQLRIITALTDRGQSTRVGMEMFDHTYQAVLDQWSAGDLTWQDFLKRSHWYANWRYDDSLYKGILDFVQKHHLKLIGLNIPFCIPPKIAVGGLDSLSAYDRAQLPDHIDTSNAAHRAYLKTIFKMHTIKGHEDFENFYAAQCAWEDGMAQAVADHLGRGSMVVLAGDGHIERKYGIPDRAYQRTKAPFRTVCLISPRMTASREDADFIWVTP